MQAISPPTLDRTEVYVGISSRRSPLATRTRLLDAQPHVTAAYNDYISARENLGALAPSITTPATGDDLRRNYGLLTESAKELREELLAGAIHGRCPFCGQGPASTLDHYLPQNRFPEFSVLPLNLIPACFSCNQRKGLLYERDGEAIFVHAYFDDVPRDTRFLFATVDPTSDGVKLRFFVEPPLGMPEPVRHRVKTHFDELGLAAYYLLEGANEIGERRAAIAAMLDEGLGVDGVKSYLVAEAASVSAEKGLNHWRSALLDGMATSATFCAGIWL